MQRVFKAWVPNVSGALSFNTLGSGSYPAQPVRANIGDHSSRFIICYQHRTLLDAVSKTLAKRNAIYGEFVCLCVGTSSDDPLCLDDTLRGRLFLFEFADDWKQDAKPMVDDAMQVLRQYPGYSVARTGSTLGNYFQGRYQDLLDNIPASCAFFVDFELERTGVVTLTMPDSIEHQISKSAPRLPTDQYDRSHMERIVCSQLFFFLKDICHNHQHHDPKSDTLVDIHEVNGDEKKWRSNVLRFLYRKVIECKRDFRPASYNSSLGVLIYAKSFRGISMREIGGGDDKFFIPPVVQDDLLETAIKAGFQNSSYKIEASDAVAGARISRYTAAWTLAVTVILLLSITPVKLSEPDLTLIHVGVLLVRYTLPCAAIAWVFYRFKHMDFGKKIDIADMWIARRSLLVLQALDQRTAGFILIGLGVASILGAILFLYFWYR
ncbi:hypothetical protein KOM00_01925 [Geomonas sp. Red69]|uniref:hypothetical protein n=1 Tax=Geomonas diazotrophica TaxID=2843197 RepID=UPI001C12196D|nr:hypothetical protein [Geomonas diazotrophica]MBU5635484.1 hypothetical protein [Geomonas diazotrophica]